MKNVPLITVIKKGGTNRFRLFSKYAFLSAYGEESIAAPFLQAHFGFRIGSVPVRYFFEASSIDFKNSTVYGLKTLGTLIKHINQRLGIKCYPIFQRNGEAESAGKG
jgi:hypothetical protein